MFGGLNVGPNEVVFATFVRPNGGCESRFNVRFFNIGTDPQVSFIMNETDRVCFQRFQPLQKGHVVIAKHKVNVGTLSRNNALP